MKIFINIPGFIHMFCFFQHVLIYFPKFMTKNRTKIHTDIAD